MIKQVRFSKAVKFFERGFCERWNVTIYKNINAPCFFAGVYNMEDVNIINKHKGFKVVWNPGRIRPFFTLLKSDNLIVCKQDSIDQNLIEGKYKIKQARFELKDLSLFKPNPLGDCICCYLGSEKLKYLYGFEEVEKLRKLTRFKILISMRDRGTSERLKRDIYDKSFVCFRGNLVGGMLTTTELALMGRETVGRTKGEPFLLYDSIEHACELIEEQSKNIGKVMGSVLNENFYDTGEEWKQVKFWL